jgi:hypothetical protein
MKICMDVEDWAISDNEAMDVQFFFVGPYFMTFRGIPQMLFAKKHVADESTAEGTKFFMFHFTIQN